MTVTALSAGAEEEIASVLVDAFRDYPVMRYVLGDAPGYSERLRILVGFFVAARVLRQEPLYGVRDTSGVLVGAAILSWSETATVPEELDRRREAVWAELGAAERARYEEYGDATRSFAIEVPHWHLNMIGLRPSHAGRGLARPLLEAVHAHARHDPHAHGVSLTTEVEANVALYEHFGYRPVGHARVGEAFDTWGMFRGQVPTGQAGP